MEIGALPTERVRSHHRLRLKAVSADRTAQLDLTQRRHYSLDTTLVLMRGNFYAM
jgi:hypothetical protein